MKIYVAVELTCDEAGVMHPQRILWEDGRKFEITSISDVRRAASTDGADASDRDDDLDTAARNAMRRWTGTV